MCSPCPSHHAPNLSSPTPSLSRTRCGQGGKRFSYRMGSIVVEYSRVKLRIRVLQTGPTRFNITGLVPAAPYRLRCTAGPGPLPPTAAGPGLLSQAGPAREPPPAFVPVLPCPISRPVSRLPSQPGGQPGGQAKGRAGGLAGGLGWGARPSATPPMETTPPLEASQGPAHPLQEANQVEIMVQTDTHGCLVATLDLTRGAVLDLRLLVPD